MVVCAFFFLCLTINYRISSMFLLPTKVVFLEFLFGYVRFLTQQLLLDEVIYFQVTEQTVSLDQYIRNRCWRFPPTFFLKLWL